jgi:trehalose 6-phosphate synthase
VASGRTIRPLPPAPGRLLGGQQLIVVSNREPCVHELAPDGTIAMRRPTSGLVTALDPVLRATGGTWIAHGSGSGDRAVTDRFDRIRVEEEDGGYTLRRVWLTRGEERGYYQGFSNSALWPLCHLAFESPRFTRSDWRHYQSVNERFADAVVSESRSASPVVLVQDYHFALLPALLRQRLPDAVIATFWHIPWPSATRFMRVPSGGALLDGLLGSDIVGFQTEDHARSFLECVAATDHPADVSNGLIGRPHGAVAVRAYPISVEWPSRWARHAPDVAECRRSVRARLGLAPDTPLMVSVDRLDYTKGIEERLLAIRRLLARGNATVGRPVFLQVGAPSRTRLERYRLLGERVRAQVAAINDRFGDAAYQPVILLEQNIEPADVFRLLRAADACHVNSLDDGMNLVSKEFVAARDDVRGVLVLSRFTGAARELSGAIMVNPFDIDGVADAIADALTMTEEEQERRMLMMRRHVEHHDVYRWASRLLADAAAVRAEHQSQSPVAAFG